MERLSIITFENLLERALNFRPRNSTLLDFPIENDRKFDHHRGTAFAPIFHRKGGSIMRPYTYFVSLSLAGVLLGNPAKGFADDTFSGPMNPGSSAVQE